MPQLIERLRGALTGRYAVERELGHGGMATVFLAEDLKHRRPVAIKVLDPELAGLLGPERFVREIETAAGLQHPHILPVLDSGSDAGLLYYVMPFVEGDTLRRRLEREGQLPVEDAVRIGVEVARALDHAHRRGIVHRDIKPENVLLADGEAVIADFGIASAIEHSGGAKLTQSGFTLGTPGYMSPEQFTGAKELDARSDVYSLGCMLYELLAGQPPFTGPLEGLARQHLSLTPRPIRELRSSVSPELAALIERSLAKLPADRPGSGAEVANALTALARTSTPDAMPAVAPAAPAPPVATSAPTRAVVAAATAPQAAGAATGADPSPAAPPPARRGSRAIAAVVVAGVIAAIVVGVTLWRARSRPPASTVGVAAQRRWVWLADFGGPAGDPSLGPSARDLVAASFEESKQLATIPDEQVRLALHNAGKPDSSRITPALARELAFRSAIPVVVEGTVGSIGGSYTLVLRATRSEDGRLIRSVSGQVASDRDLIPEITRLAREMRRSLGEDPDVFRGTQSWADAPTPSLEAFKLYRAGREYVIRNLDGQAIPLLRQAIAADPEFATAWAYLGTAYGNLGLVDSAIAARQEALRHPARLTPARKLYIEAAIAGTNGDRAEALAAYDALLQLNPSPVDRMAALVNRAGTLADMGRNEEALASLRTAASVSPIETVPTVSLNMAGILTGLNRLGEARSLISNRSDPPALIALLSIELSDRKWGAAESLATSILSISTFPEVMRGMTAFALGGVCMARGRFGEADRHFDDMFPAGLGPRPIGIRWLNLEGLSLVRGGSPPAYPLDRRNDSWAVTARAIRAARSGDATRARALVASWPDPHDPDGREALEGYVEATLDARDAKWAHAVQVLAPVARRGFWRVPPGVDAALRPSCRWRVADAFAHLDQPDSAAAYLELILNPPANEPPASFASAAWEPFVRRKLIELAIRAGRIEEARRQWDLLSETCTQPDPEAQRLLDETRSMVRAAVGIGEAGRN